MQSCSPRRWPQSIYRWGCTGPPTAPAPLRHPWISASPLHAQSPRCRFARLQHVRALPPAPRTSVTAHAARTAAGTRPRSRRSPLSTRRWPRTKWWLDDECPAPPLRPTPARLAILYRFDPGNYRIYRPAGDVGGVPPGPVRPSRRMRRATMPRASRKVPCTMLMLRPSMRALISRASSMHAASSSVNT